MKALPDIRRATAELVRVRGELRRVESRIDVICGTLREAIADSFGSDLESPFLVAEGTLAARIADAVGSRLSQLSQ